jgi:hypothetical protein
MIYNYDLDVSAKDVHKLHAKVVYYDSNRKEIGTDFIFGGKDGTFEENFSKTLLSPAGTKYIQLNIFADPQRNNSAYIIKTVKIERVIPSPITLRYGGLVGCGNVSILGQTKPFPVEPNAGYNYSMYIEGQNITSLVGVALFRNSKDTAENPLKYASRGNVLSNPGSLIYTRLDISKPSNYTVALRANTCQNCSGLLTVGIEDTNGNLNETVLIFGYNI